mgnify:CR=1 FL=1
MKNTTAKVVEDSWNIIDLVKHPNKFSAIIAGIFVLVIVLINFAHIAD